ncbi:MAG TPA: CsiV family protein [Gammaproteobacteria bacterium]|nr:CsiV family protein [Gammaproteobacteria bacterium]
MTICKHKRLTAAMPLIATLLLAALHAPVNAAPAVYDVELIIFRHKVNSDAGEQWNTAAAEDFTPARVFSQDGFTELSPTLYQLDAIRGGLRNSSGYTVLLHRAWRQVGYDAAHAIAYPIHAAVGNGRESLDGSVTLVRERYLHLDVDLMLTTAGSGSPGQYVEGQDSRPVYRLHEKRRMRSREVHYLDHPRFGIIAVVTPYDAPEDEPEPEPEPAETTGDPGAEYIPVTGSGPDDDQLTR